MNACRSSFDCGPPLPHLRAAAARVILAICLIFPGSLAFAQRNPGDPATDRYVALVIGNGKYQGELALAQPAADATAVAKALRTRGFQIVSSAGGVCGDGGPLTDLNRESMQAATACFAKATAGAKQAIFYFSGHSATIDGHNYLVPIGATATVNSAPGELVDLKSILETIEQTRADISVIILDAARIGAKSITGAGVGLGRVAPTTGSLRIVAYSAPVGAWTNDSEPPRNRSEERDRGAGPGGSTQSKPDPTDALSPYTRRLVRLIVDDSEARSLDQSGTNVDTILLKASKVEGSAPGEIMNENATGTEMLGRMPRIGKSACEVLNWRAEAFEYCIEIAAAYESCGKDTAMRRRLQNQCPADWKALLRYSLRASMVGAMKTKNCATLTSLVTKFETEPGVRELDEFKEVSSLARFTCATESNAKPLPVPSPSPSPSASPAVVAAKDSPDVRSKSASPASPASADFVISENRDIYGKDIPQADGTIGQASTDIGACTNQCQSIPSCVAVSFDRWKNKCYPKNSVATALLDARSSIAVKKPLPTPPTATAKTEFQTIRNSRFSSDLITRKRVASFEACRMSCDDESRCVAFTFLKTAVKNSANCELFRLTGASTRDSATDSGYKFQSP